MKGEGGGKEQRVALSLHAERSGGEGIMTSKSAYKVAKEQEE